MQSLHAAHLFLFRDSEIEKLREKNEELADQIIALKCRFTKCNLNFYGFHRG